MSPTYDHSLLTEGEIPARAVRAVAAVGIADAISAFFFGFFSSDTPVQLFSHDFPNRVIEYPTGLIPLFLICFAVCMHVLSLAELRRSLLCQRSRPGLCGERDSTGHRVT